MPSVVLKNYNDNRNQVSEIIEDYEYEKHKEKNLINQILELHEKKKKKDQQQINKKLKIYFSPGINEISQFKWKKYRK